MGIRYYAYAFDACHTHRALSDPRAFISQDPLADAWGFEPGATIVSTDFRQSVPERDMLYLDKAWRELQLLTRPAARRTPPRPAYRMFEGQVTLDGPGWIGWCRALAPQEMPEIALDLADLEEELGAAAFGVSDAEDDARYQWHFLTRARRFVSGLAEDGRGMAYLIG